MMLEKILVAHPTNHTPEASHVIVYKYPMGHAKQQEALVYLPKKKYPQLKKSAIQEREEHYQEHTHEKPPIC